MTLPMTHLERSGGWSNFEDCIPIGPEHAVEWSCDCAGKAEQVQSKTQTCQTTSGSGSRSMFIPPDTKFQFQ